MPKLRGIALHSDSGSLSMTQPPEPQFQARAQAQAHLHPEAQLQPEARLQPEERPRVGFRQAMYRWWKYLFHFSGRASRSEFWWPQLVLGPIAGSATVAGGLCFLLILWTLFPLSEPGSAHVLHVAGAAAVFLLLGLAAAALLATAVVVLELSLLWRRLHDHNLSGIWGAACLVALQVPHVRWIALVVLVVLLCLPSDPQGCRFDRPRDIGRP